MVNGLFVVKIKGNLKNVAKTEARKRRKESKITALGGQKGAFRCRERVGKGSVMKRMISKNNIAEI